MNKLIFLTEAVLEEEEDLYALVQKLQSDMSDLLDVTGDISDKLLQHPKAEQLDYVTAFLFMLVCFELMRLVYRWTKSYKYHGKVGE